MDTILKTGDTIWERGTGRKFVVIKVTTEEVQELDRTTRSSIEHLIESDNSNNTLYGVIDERILNSKGFSLTPPVKKATAKWPNGSEKVAPVIGTRYWYIDNEHGAVDDTYEGYTFDNLKLGNKELFLTVESASKADTMKDRKAEMMVEIGKIDKDWTADWEDEHQEKCFIYLAYNRNKFSVLCADSRTYSQGITYMSQKAAQHILSDTYTDEDRMAFMGIVGVEDKKEK